MYPRRLEYWLEPRLFADIVRLNSCFWVVNQYSLNCTEICHTFPSFKKIRSWHRHYKRSKQIESVLSWKSAWPHSAFSAWPTLSRGETIAFCMTHDQPQRLRVKLGERWVSTKIQSNMFIKFLFDALHMLAPDRGDPPCHFRSEKLWCIPWYSRKSAQWGAAKQFFVMSSWCWARTHLNSIGRRIEATKKWSELNMRAQTAIIWTRKPGSQSIGNFNQSI